jgi:hypothetical protein
VNVNTPLLLNPDGGPRLKIAPSDVTSEVTATLDIDPPVPTKNPSRVPELNNIEAPNATAPESFRARFGLGLAMNEEKVPVPADVATESPVAAILTRPPPAPGSYRKIPLPEVPPLKFAVNATWPVLLIGDGGPKLSATWAKVVPAIGVPSPIAATFDKPASGDHERMALDDGPPIKSD